MPRGTIAIALFHFQRLVLALRLFPVGARGNAPHLVPGVCDRLQSAVLRVRTAGLERHHERLSGRMHDRVRDLEAALVDAREDLEADADPRFWAGLAPRVFRGGDRRKQRFEIDARIGDAERDPIRRAFAADGADRSGEADRKRLVRQRVERGFAGVGGAFAVDLRTRRLGKRRPVAALGDRLHRLVQQRAVALE